MLEVRDLTVGYESPVIMDLSLSVPPGKVVSLMGRNGVGKTTLIKAIMGILSPTAGEIHWQGEDITHTPPNRRARAGLGYVPQGRDIFPHLSVRENLLMGRESLGESETEGDIDEMVEIFPVLGEKIDAAGGTLSGGQQQQLAIARILMGKPEILLLDEPAAGIQPSIVQRIGEVIRQLNEQRDMTVLLVEQFVDFALELSDHVYVMREGKIVMEEPVETIQRDRIETHLSV